MIKRRPRKSVEQWKAVIADQQASGLSRVDYCLKHDIHIDTFSARLSDINRGLNGRSNQTSNSIDKPQLVKVTKAPRNTQHEFIAIAFAIEAMETSLEIKAEKNFTGMQPGDVYQTYAEVEDLFEVTGQRAKTPVKEGVANFVEWYKDYYKLENIR